MIPSPASCPPNDSSVSTFDGRPVAIISRAYSDVKDRPGSTDVLWGFQPMSFEFSTVQRALLWIVEEMWTLPVSH